MSGIVIVDYGMGNLGSVADAFAALGVQCRIADAPAGLRGARGIVLPGVGAFGAAMTNLRERRLDGALTASVLERRTPFLGICLGLQLIADDSTEHGFARGLGWVRGHVLRMEPGPPYPVPHVGWNEVEFRSGARLFERVAPGAHFYFDHSYHLDGGAEGATATCSYGRPWIAALEKDNIHAVQFHPEKSQRNGLRVLRNFARYVDACHA